MTPQPTTRGPENAATPRNTPGGSLRYSEAEIDYSAPSLKPEPLITFTARCDVCGHDADWTTVKHPGNEYGGAPKFLFDIDCAACESWTWQAQLRRRRAA